MDLAGRDCEVDAAQDLSTCHPSVEVVDLEQGGLRSHNAYSITPIRVVEKQVRAPKADARRLATSYLHGRASEGLRGESEGRNVVSGA